MKIDDFIQTVKNLYYLNLDDTFINTISTSKYKNNYNMIKSHLFEYDGNKNLISVEVFINNFLINFSKELDITITESYKDVIEYVKNITEGITENNKKIIEINKNSKKIELAIEKYHNSLYDKVTTFLRVRIDNNLINSRFSVTIKNNTIIIKYDPSPKQFYYQTEDKKILFNPKYVPDDYGNIDGKKKRYPIVSKHGELTNIYDSKMTNENIAKDEKILNIIDMLLKLLNVFIIGYGRH